MFQPGCWENPETAICHAFVVNSEWLKWLPSGYLT
jgi:hypothetical protein